jgi:hypothetical protein
LALIRQGSNYHLLPRIVLLVWFIAELLSGVQFIEQVLGFVQIARVEAFCEPPVKRSQEFARLLHLALFAPEAGEARRGAEFPGLASCLRPTASALKWMNTYCGLQFCCHAAGFRESINTNATRQTLALLLTQAWFVPCWINTSPAFR